MSAEAHPDGLFLPDFCGIRTVFGIVLGGELLACVLVLSQASGAGGLLASWRQLALVSLFVQWVALTSAGVLCPARPLLARLGNAGAGVVTFAVVLAMTAAFSALALAFVLRPGGGGDAVVHALGVPLPTSRFDRMFVLRNMGISAIVAAVALRYFYVQHQWRANVESEARSRVQALQSRIRPHFLFNSMNTIASLTRTDPVLAEQVTEDLADLFRVSIADASVPATLERELDVCRQYLRIEQLRLGERLRYDLDLDGLPGDALIPGLTLQPLVENAVYHGVEPAGDGGSIAVTGTCDGKRLRLRVDNSVPRVEVRRSREGHRMALDNVAQRIAAFYGAPATLEVEEGEERYRVSLDLPYEARGGG